MDDSGSAFFDISQDYIGRVIYHSSPASYENFGS